LLLSGNSTIGSTGQSLAAKTQTSIPVPATVPTKFYRLFKP